jgi:hypothetical protein
VDGTEVRKYTTVEQWNAGISRENDNAGRGPRREMSDKRTKTTASIPADLYGQMWQLIASERSAGRRLTAQDIMVEALRDYLESRKKDAAA